MGICYAHLGKKQEALAAFDKALELDPDYEPAILNRSIVNSLKKGEKLGAEFVAIEYYKDRTEKKRPLKERLSKLFEK